MALPPPTGVEMGAFYPILGVMELTAEFGYTLVVYQNGQFEIGAFFRHETCRILSMQIL
jgi:hypothetical protein